MTNNSNCSCLVSGCERPLYRKSGYCSAHYERFKKYGDPLAGGVFHQKRPEKCCADGCDKKVIARGFCPAHYSLFQKYGDHTKAKYKWYQNGRDEWHECSTGYIWRYVGRNDPHASKHTGYAYQHRVVMAGMIGRTLFGNESVHHKNGDRTDNRPENLELWVKSQPAGQRVSDMVDWARQILKDYEKIV